MPVSQSAGQPIMLARIPAHTQRRPINPMPSYALRKAACQILPDRWFAKLLYLKHHGRLPRTPPVSFTERVGARLGATEMERYQDYCDKRAVRDLVTPKIGPDYMVPLHATADRLTREAETNRSG